MRGLLCLLSPFLGAFVPAAGGASAAEPFSYETGKHGKGELTYIGKTKALKGVPVLILEGSPEQIGEQIGILAVQQAKPLYNFPRQYFRQECTNMLRATFPNLAKEKIEAMEDKELWPRFQKIAMKLENNFPKTHLGELEALIKAGNLDREQLIAANAMFDLGHISPTELLAGCSSLIIPPERSATGGLLFGRNLDFSHFGYLHHYSLLMVYQSNDRTKHSFVSAGFPGFVGCFTGMNDAGLTIASHEVFDPITKKPFNDKGIPFAMAYRRILEDCNTVAAAIDFLKELNRASVTSLVIADGKEGAVIEVTPAEIAVRRFENKPGVCTNHFCTEGKYFKNPNQTDKFDTITRFKQLSESVTKTEKVGIDDIRKRLHEARLIDRRVPGRKIELTIQTFVFEPGSRKLHVRFSTGNEPATEGELTTLDLNRFWGK